MDLNAFSPMGSTVNLAVTATTGNVALTVPGRQNTVRVVNAGPNTAFLNFGTSDAVTATAAAGMPILNGAEKVFALSREITHCAGICASGETAAVYFTSGMGT